MHKMNLSSIHTLMAESVIKDESGKISIINIFDRVYAPSIPTAQQKLVIVFGLKSKKKGRINEKLTLYAYSPKNKLFLEAPIDAKLDASDSNEGNLVADLSGMPITEYGTYQFLLGYDKDTILAKKTLEVLPLKVKDK